MIKNRLLALSLIALMTTTVQATDMDPEDLFEYLKTTLQGEWKLSSADKQIDTADAYKHPYVLPLVGTDATGISYKYIGYGSTLQEDLLPNTKKQMVTMYHCDDYVDCTQILATHYCTKMNQPQFILDLNKTTKEKIIFNCDMSTKLCQSKEDHIHQIIMEFSKDGKHLKSSYLGWTDQKPNKKNSIYHFDKK
jgi:hypothetical protein